VIKREAGEEDEENIRTWGNVGESEGEDSISQGPKTFMGTMLLYE
jgi:hypothetical protein